MKPTRRRVLELTGAAAAAPLTLSPASAQKSPAATKSLVMNDASRLSPTPVRAHWIVRPDDEKNLIEKLRTELKAATAEKRPVVVGAARHSMGGQSLPRDGTAITFAIPRIEPDTKKKTFEVHAGTRWTEVIKALDPVGFSPAVMQSNADFGIASTFSVNAHGWPVPYGPFGSTVRRVEMMLADGTIVACSRSENAELFKLAMGGYGYFGIILKLEVDMVENRLLKPTFQTMPSSAFAPRFIAAAIDPAVSMLYGRLDVTRSRFFQQALLVSYRNAPKRPEKLPPVDMGGGFGSFLTRRVYRAQIGSETGRRARWFAETVAGPKSSSGIATRNSLMSEPVANLASGDRARTDILHEYFVPADRFNEFVKACQELIVPSDQEFLNITLRYVAADADSVMAFAPTPRIAGVMSFSQRVTPQGEAGMKKLTEALIERVGALGGAFYLPYRLHARPDQVAKIYPRTAEFVAAKRRYDPALVFQNAMWPAYFAPQS
jgi:FAD/FMN-containing dehydrogenase